MSAIVEDKSMCEFCGDFVQEELIEGKCKSCRYIDAKIIADAEQLAQAEISKVKFAEKKVTIPLSKSNVTMKVPCWKGLCYHSAFFDIDVPEDEQEYVVTSIKLGVKFPFEFDSPVAAALFLVRVAELVDWETFDGKDLYKELVHKINSINFDVLSEIPPKEW